MSIRFCKNNIACGSVTPPPSKSLLHRHIICASLCDKTTIISNVKLSQDVLATIDCMRKLGATITFDENYLTITGINQIVKIPEITFYCNQSASTLRFLLPLSTLFCKNAKFQCHQSLLNRSLFPYKQCVALHQDVVISDNNVCASGLILPGEYIIDASQSSQFVSGLLFTLPLLNGNSKIILTGKLVSKAYLDMTVNVLTKHGIIIEETEYGFNINGNQRYLQYNCRIENDFSQTAFFLIAGAISGKVTCDNINTDSIQGDKYIIDLLLKIGCNIKIENRSVTTFKTQPLTPFILDCDAYPDLALPLCVLAGTIMGESVFINTNRLKTKESNRQAAIISLLTELGCNVTLKNENIHINGVPSFKSAIIDSRYDHRTAMSTAIASLFCDGEIILLNENAVNKSYPDFYKDFEKIGGRFYVE
ncbi:MAG: 3-phosphoshikimate 1-carboxyvinyltransferase [Oscillospiraceae bacterium]